MLRIAVIIFASVLFLSGKKLFSQSDSRNDPSGRYIPSYAEVDPVCDCGDLAKVSLPNTVIESAVIFPSDSSCRVTAIVTHPPFKDRVKIIIALPAKNWNGRFYGTGGGGFLGGTIWSLHEPVSQGFAAGATDTGHDGGSGSFALDQEQNRLRWQEIRNFAYLGIHDMTIVGKALVQAFYGMPAQYSYFVGNSTGGRQALMEAQRYPGDYDGILSGCPAVNWSRFLIADLWPQALMRDNNNYVSREKLDAVTKAVITECDEDDGLVDGVITDPLNCTWDPEEFIGTPVGETIFSKADADLVRRIWEGPRTYDGKFLWYGLPRGANMSALAGTIGNPLTGAPFSIPLEWVRYFLVQNPEWDITSLTLAEFELLFNQSVDQYNEVIGTANPDLSGFRDYGGKLIIIHGLADQLVPPQGTISYFEQVQKQMGGARTTSKFARLFLIPGVDHAFRGAGPGPVGHFDALVRWVEDGKAPDRLNTELKDNSGNIVRSDILLPFMN